MRSAQDLHAMADFLRTLANIEDEPITGRLLEVADALDGCARQIGTVDILRGEMEVMHDRELVAEAHAHAEDGFPPAPRC